MTTLSDPQKLADMLGVQVSVVNDWAADLSVIADACLSSLAPVTAERALYYLVAYWIDVSGGEVSSESLGDASVSYAQKQGGMQANQYGKMALLFAPCLAAISPTKQYRVWLV